jgi:3-oxoacyl-[acyl-carrier-protein] synthase II
MSYDDDVVVSGIGIIGPLGVRRDEFWANLIDGRCGLAAAGDSWGRLAGNPIGLVREEFQIEPDFFDRSAAPRLTRSERIAASCAREAMDHSGAVDETTDRYRIGVYVGTCAGGVQAEVTAVGVESTEMLGEDPRRALESLADAVAAAVGSTGPRLTVNTACAGGAHAIGVAFEHLYAGDVDVAIAGGVDEVNPLTLAGFASLGALDPKMCNPYGRSAGLNLGEGAAFLVLERASRLAARGKASIAGLLGYGFSADAHHPSGPDPAGYGPELAIRRALAHADVRAESVEYVNGHGTATMANDAMERELLIRVFNASARKLPVSSTKSATGHALAGSAAIEAAVSALAIQRGMLPPTVNHCGDAQLDVVPGRGRQAEIAVAASMSYAFGGNNACLLLGNDSTRKRHGRSVDDVVVTGVGLVGSPGLGQAAWSAAFENGTISLTPEVIDRGKDRATVQIMTGRPPPLEGSELATRREWRRMDVMARLCLSATSLAIDDARASSLVGRDDVAVIIGTQSGPYDTSVEFHAGARRGFRSINPAVFANAPLSSTAGHICSALRWHGPTVTVASGWTSALNALLYGRHLLIAERVDTVVVIGADVLCSEVIDDFASLIAPSGDPVLPFDRRATGIGLGSAAVAMILELRSTAVRSKRHVYARIAGGAATGDNVVHQEPSRHFSDSERCMQRALANSSVQPGDVDLVAASACGLADVDEAEAAAIEAVFPGAPFTTAPKALVGECRGADGLIAVAAGLFAIAGSWVPPIPGLDQPVATSLRFAAVGDAVKQDIRTVVASAASPGGNRVSVVMRAP